MDRALTVGAASGSFTAIGFRVLSELLRSSPPLPDCPGCPLCPELPEIPIIELPERLDLVSLVIGIVVGLSIGPLLDLLYLLRQTWRAWIRTRLSELARRNPEALYRLAWALRWLHLTLWCSGWSVSLHLFDWRWERCAGEWKLWRVLLLRTQLVIFLWSPNSLPPIPIVYLVGNPELLGIVWGLREKRSAVQSASGFAELFQGCLEAHLDESGLIWLHVFIWFAEISVATITILLCFSPAGRLQRIFAFIKVNQVIRCSLVCPPRPRPWSVLKLLACSCRPLLEGNDWGELRGRRGAWALRPPRTFCILRYRDRLRLRSWSFDRGGSAHHRGLHLSVCGGSISFGGSSW